jgi:hypothetical protein
VQAFLHVARRQARVSAAITLVICPRGRGAHTLVGMTPQYWYGPKRFPFGHRLPVTWQGWLVDVAWMATCLAISPLLRKDSQYPLQGLGLWFGLSVVFIAFRSWKGEPQRDA